MNILVCEKSLVGFLSAVYDSYYTCKNADIITADINDCTLTDSFCASGESMVKARRVRDGIIKKGGNFAYDSVLDAYLSGDRSKEKKIYEFLRLFFARGRTAFEAYDRPCVVDFNDMVRNVRHEIHRVSAFVRFQEMKNGIYYGFFRADNDILERIAQNLAPRFNTQKFVLHDYERRKMALFDGKEVCYCIAPDKVEIELSEDEDKFVSMWKNYTRNVSIASRENLRLQQNFVPKKYRIFMNEF